MPLVYLRCHILEPFFLTVRLDVTQEILHCQNLIHMLNLDQRVDGFHQIISGPVATIEPVHSDTIHPLLSSAGNGYQMFLIFLTESVRDLCVDLVAQFNVWGVKSY